MRSTTILRGASSLAISTIMVLSLILTACGNRAGNQMESKDPGTGAAARNDGNALAANPASPATSSAATTDKPVPGPTEKRNNNQQVASVPTPQIGTGGSDFFLFTQARAALEADVELRTANIVIDVKGGLLTLSGSVANAEHRSKAELLVQSLNGVKAVKNQLRISSTAAEAKTRVG